MRASTTAPFSRRAAAIAAGIVLLLPALWHVRTLAAVVAARLSYPADIEWMESGHLYQAYRVGEGLPIYTDPSSGFAPFPYPPLFWIVLAGAGKIFGLGYATGRGVSVACLAASIAILAVAVARRAPSRAIGVAFGLVAAASIGAGYPFGEGTFDLARSDAMATFFPVAAAALAGDGRLSRGRAIATAVAIVASVFTKQTGVFFAVWIVAFVVVRDGRRGVVFAATTVTLGAAWLVALLLSSHGWVWTWLVDMGRHDVLFDQWADPIAPFVRHDPFLLCVPLMVGWLRWERRLSPEAIKWSGTFVAALVGALLAKMKRGGWVNVYMPVLVLSWPVTLYLACDVLRAMWPNRTRALRTAWGMMLGSSITLRLLEYHVHPFLPTDRQLRDAERLDAFVRELDADVVITSNAFAAVRAGTHRTQPMLQAYFDAAAAGMRVDYADALDRSGATWIITTGITYEGDLVDRLDTRFERVRELDFHWGTIAGWDHGNPKTLWKRRSPP